MTTATPSVNASSAPMKNFEKVVSPPGTTTATTSHTRCQVFVFETPVCLPPQTPAKYRSVRALVEQWEQVQEKRDALEKGRRWIADTFYGEDGDTVRTLRLRKGWSQTRFAEVLGTSQSHVARIERGTENLSVETCRKLAAALDIDMNTLDQMLRRQEAIAKARKK